MDQDALRLFTCALRNLKGFGSLSYTRLVETYEGIENAYAAYLGQELPPQLSQVLDFKQAEKWLAKQDSLGNKVTFRWQHEYPLLLNQIPDAPICLLSRRHMAEFDWANCIAVVGTRKPTSQGCKWCEDIVKVLTEKGFVIVSGLAMGIDSKVHQSVLNAGGKTIAVLPGSLQKPLPVSNSWLADKILRDQGDLISEFADITEVHQGSFVARNRIVAGLCKATIVIEAGEKSGSLITANMAFDYGREVYAVPGSMGMQTFLGNNQLIANNVATLIHSYEALITKLLGNKEPLSTRILEEEIDISSRSGDEIKLLSLLSDGELNIDEIREKVDISVEHILSLLTLLQMEGFIAQNEQNDYYLRVKIKLR